MPNGQDDRINPPIPCPRCGGTKKYDNWTELNKHIEEKHIAKKGK